MSTSGIRLFGRRNSLAKVNRKIFGDKYGNEIQG